MMIPPLPLKNTKLMDKVLNRRQKQFQRFLQAISRSEDLKASSLVIEFLTIVDLKDW